MNMKSSNQKRAKKAGLSPGSLIHVGSKYIAIDKKICSIYQYII